MFYCGGVITKPDGAVKNPYQEVLSHIHMYHPTFLWICPSQITSQLLSVKMSKGAPTYSQLVHIWGWPKPHLLYGSSMEWTKVFCIVLECAYVWPHPAKWLKQEDPIINFGNFTTKTYTLTEVPRTTNIYPGVHSPAADSPSLRCLKELLHVLPRKNILSQIGFFNAFLA